MVTKAPIVKIKAPPPAGPPPATSKTQDTYSHHTSPVKGPQAQPAEVATAQAPRAKTSITKLPKGPNYVTKHGDDS